MAMKEYSTLPISPELEPHHQMHLLCYVQDNSQRILSPADGAMFFFLLFRFNLSRFWNDALSLFLKLFRLLFSSLQFWLLRFSRSALRSFSFYLMFWDEVLCLITRFTQIILHSFSLSSLFHVIKITKLRIRFRIIRGIKIWIRSFPELQKVIFMFELIISGFELEIFGKNVIELFLCPLLSKIKFRSFF